MRLWWPRWLEWAVKDGVKYTENLGSHSSWPQATPPSTHETSLPPPHPLAITIGAITIIDEKAEFSNWGACQAPKLIFSENFL